MRTIWIGIRKCFLSLIAGFLWLPFLFKNASGDVGYEYSGQASIFLGLGTVLPIGVIRIFWEISNFSNIDLIFTGLITYLFLGLLANLSFRSEWGRGFLPIPCVVDGKVIM